MTGEKQNRWFAVRTKPRQERLAEKALSFRDIETFYPVVLKSNLRRASPHRASGDRAQRGSGGVSAERPYFTGYIFVCLKAAQSLRSVNTAYGVSSIVHAGLIPLEIPAWAIENLKARAERTADSWLMKAPQERLRSGARHRICTGCFEGFIAQITKVDGKGRIGVFIQGLSNSLPAVLSAFDLGEEISPIVRQQSEMAQVAV